MAGKVADALLGLTQYLQGENQRLDIEEKEKKIELVAEHVADKFQDLGPDASLQEIQGLQFELIEDAAALGGLQENLPLISGLMQSMMNTRQMQKLEDEDAALNKFVRDKYGITGGEGLSGQQIGALAHQFKGYEKDILVKDEDQTITLKTFDMNRQEVFSLKVDSFGTAQQMAIFKDQAGYKHGLSKDLIRYKAKQDAKANKSGFKFMQGKVGSNGENLWTYADGTGLLTQRKDGTMIAWDGDRGAIVNRGPGESGTDVLAGLEKTSEYYGGERYKSASALLLTEDGPEAITRITGIMPGDQTKEDKAGNTVLTGAVMEKLDQFYAKDTETINEVLKEAGIEEGSEIRTTLDAIQGSYKSELTMKDMFLQNIPKTYLDDIVNEKEWNEGVSGIRPIFEDPNVDEDAKAYVSNYVGAHLGLPTNSVVTMGDYSNLGFEQKMPLIKAISHSTDYIIDLGSPWTTPENPEIPKYKTPVDIKKEEEAIKENIRKNMDMTDMPAHYLRTKF